MKITHVETRLLKVPVESEIGDSKRSVSHLEFVCIRLVTSSGIVGTGYTITVGHGGSVIKAVLDDLFADDLKGADPHQVRDIWRQLYFGKAHWIGRSGTTTMAQAAVDIALWDIIAKDAGQPLYKVLGAARSGPMPIYNTHAGWLNFSPERLRDEALEQIEEGYTALKMKVGKPDLSEDIRRVEHVRDVIGPDIMLMVDANQAWDVQTSLRAARELERFNLGWLEEPLHPDDIRGASEVRSKTAIPIALGEHVYSVHAFQQFVEQKAVDVIQVDVCRVGGITPWLEVAAIANAAGLRVCPHAGDLMQVHQHLVRAIPNSWLLEVIPLWETGPFVNQIKLERGFAHAPEDIGASSDFTDDAWTRFAVQ